MIPWRDPFINFIKSSFASITLQYKLSTSQPVDWHYFSRTNVSCGKQKQDFNALAKRPQATSSNTTEPCALIPLPGFDVNLLDFYFNVCPNFNILPSWSSASSADLVV